MLPILYFIDQYLIDLFIWVIIGSAILSWLIAFNVVNPYNQFVRSLWDLFNRITAEFLAQVDSGRWRPKDTRASGKSTMDAKVLSKGKRAS